jgi:hypothetical protein
MVASSFLRSNYSTVEANHLVRQSQTDRGLAGAATKRLSTTVLFVSGPKCPYAQAAGDHHSNPGDPDGYVDTSDMHRPLIQCPHSLKNGYHTEEGT